VEALHVARQDWAVLIPMEDTIEMRGGKKVISSRMSYPGYVLWRWTWTRITWHIVRNTAAGYRVRRVSYFAFAFVGGGGGRDYQSRAYANRSAETQVVLSAMNRCGLWTGRFANFNGTVEEIDGDHSRLKVSVTIFGGRHRGVGFRQRGEIG